MDIQHFILFCVTFLWCHMCFYKMACFMWSSSRVFCVIWTRFFSVISSVIRSFLAISRQVYCDLNSLVPVHFFFVISNEFLRVQLVLIVLHCIVSVTALLKLASTIAQHGFDYQIKLLCHQDFSKMSHFDWVMHTELSKLGLCFHIRS